MQAQPLPGYDTDGARVRLLGRPLSQGFQRRRRRPGRRRGSVSWRRKGARWRGGVRWHGSNICPPSWAFQRNPLIQTSRPTFEHQNHDRPGINHHSRLEVSPGSDRRPSFPYWEGKRDSRSRGCRSSPVTVYPRGFPFWEANRPLLEWTIARGSIVLQNE